MRFSFSVPPPWSVIDFGSRTNRLRVGILKSAGTGGGGCGGVALDPAPRSSTRELPSASLRRQYRVRWLAAPRSSALAICTRIGFDPRRSESDASSSFEWVKVRTCGTEDGMCSGPPVDIPSICLHPSTASALAESRVALRAVNAGAPRVRGAQPFHEV
eukprot:scaffold1770_cov129-Isochrysis_galbana.AAC.4